MEERTKIFHWDQLCHPYHHLYLHLLQSFQPRAILSNQSPSRLPTSLSQSYHLSPSLLHHPHFSLSELQTGQHPPSAARLIPPSISKSLFHHPQTIFTPHPSKISTTNGHPRISSSSHDNQLMLGAISTDHIATPSQSLSVCFLSLRILILQVFLDAWNSRKAKPRHLQELIKPQCWRQNFSLRSPPPLPASSSPSRRFPTRIGSCRDAVLWWWSCSIR